MVACAMRARRRASASAESYMDMDNRAFFEDETVGLEGLDRSNGKTHEDFCRPVAIGGQVLAFARERLIARAEAIGWTPEHDPDLRLLVDGQVHRPLSDGDTAVFMFPAAARDVRLASTTFVPAHIGVSWGFASSDSPSPDRAEARGASPSTMRASARGSTTAKPRAGHSGAGPRASWSLIRNSGPKCPDTWPCSSSTARRRRAAGTPRRSGSDVSDLRRPPPARESADSIRWGKRPSSLVYPS
jgi:hypothetical protein